MSQVMMPFVQAAVLLSFCTVYGIAQTMSNCSCGGSIGKRPATIDTAPTDTSSSSLSGLFLNTNYTATCNGTVTAWDFCYYVINTQQQDQESTNIQAGVWRKVGREQQDTKYELVDNSLIDLPIPSPESGFQFICRHWSLNSTNNETFEAQKGDVVGMYVNNTSMVHILGIPATNEQHNGIVKSIGIKITDIESQVSVNQLSNTVYSLYLMAMIGNCTSTCGDSSTTSPNSTTIDPTTTEVSIDPLSLTTNFLSTTKSPSDQSTPANNSTEPLGTLWPYFVIAGLVAFIFLLFIIIIATICKFCSLHKRRKGSVPVLITKMKNGNQRVTRMMTITKEPAQHNDSTDTEAGNIGPSQHRSQHPVDKPRPPLLNTDTSQQLPDQGYSPSGNMSPPPVVIAVSFDIEQQPNDDHKLKPNPQKSSCNAEKKALFPKSNMKRSHSAVDATNILYNSNDESSPITTSTEYPYVLHAFEVVGKNRMHTGSLPNVLEHCSIDDQTTKLCGDNQDGTAYAQIDAEDSNSDADNDEPSYSYADRRHMNLVYNATKDLKRKRAIVIPAKNQDYHYGEYPTAWCPTSQLEFQSTKQNEYMMGAHNQSKSSAQQSNHALSNEMQNDALPANLKPKPIIRPRKKAAFIVTSNSKIIHPPVGMHTDVASHQPPQMASSNLMVEHQASTDELDNSATSVAQTPPKYMKLLGTTNDFHKNMYMYLLTGDTELSELSTGDTAAERAHPNEWYKQTNC